MISYSRKRCLWLYLTRLGHGLLRLGKNYSVLGMCEGGKTAMNGFFLLCLDLYSGQVTVNFRLCKPE
jgi:hypothetical protein